jgi:hypothetical protein
VRSSSKEDTLTSWAWPSARTNAVSAGSLHRGADSSVRQRSSAAAISSGVDPMTKLAEGMRTRFREGGTSHKMEGASSGEGAVAGTGKKAR